MADCQNLAALSLVQGANAAVPLIIFPYALHVVGAGAYAELAFGEAIAMVFATFVLYSFDIDGIARVIGRNRAGVDEPISHIVNEILFARLIIFSTLLAPVIALATVCGALPLRAMAYWMLVPLSYALQPTWLFQALENNVPLAIFTILSRLGLVIAVFSLINSPADAELVPLIIGIAYVTNAVISLCYIVNTQHLRLKLIARDRLWRCLLDGKEIFFGNISVILYRDLNVVLLGAFGVAGESVAAYSIAEKTVKSIQALTRPLNQFAFPRAVALARMHCYANRIVLREIGGLLRMQFMLLAGLAVILLGGYLCLNTRLSEMFGFHEVRTILHMASIMAPAIFLGMANSMLGVAGLNQLNDRLYLFRSILIAGLASVTFCVSTLTFLGGTAAAIAYTLAEVVLLAAILRRYCLTSIRVDIHNTALTKPGRAT